MVGKEKKRIKRLKSTFLIGEKIIKLKEAELLKLRESRLFQLRKIDNLKFGKGL